MTNKKEEPKKGNEFVDKATEWVKKKAPIVKKKSKELYAKSVVVAKDASKKSKELYEKSKPHVKKAYKDVKTATKKGYDEFKPKAQKAYSDFKPYVKKYAGETKKFVSKTGETVRSKNIFKSKYLIGGVIAISIIIAIIVFYNSSSSAPTTGNYDEYKFPDERKFDYPKPTPIECAEGMEGECNKGFFEPSKEEGTCPISCDDDDECTLDLCDDINCVNTPIEGCSLV